MPSINWPIRSVPKCAARRLCERVLRAAQPPEAPCASLLPTPQPAPSAIFGIREVIERCLALRARGEQLAMHSRELTDPSNARWMVPLAACPSEIFWQAWNKTRRARLYLSTTSRKEVDPSP